MSTERAWIVGLPIDDGYQSLATDITSAAGRATKAEPGDRLDVARFEALATRLEQAAINTPGAPRTPVEIPENPADTILFGTDPAAWPAGLSADIRAAAQSCVSRQLLPVLVIDPFGAGATASGQDITAEDPAERWASEDGVTGRRAVEARFRAQIIEALTPNARRRVPISPSGIQNPVVTEILREFVAVAPGSVRVDAPVEYRDGSKSAHQFPLRSLPLVDVAPPLSLTLRFTLLSIRHTEMDAVVDGAWLRNAEVSRPRPAAQTDDLVYKISLQQLDELCRGERHVHLHMYQTGLETAVVGFYRAVVTHLLRRPRSISVTPMYFEAPQPLRGNRSGQRDRRPRNGGRGPGGRPERNRNGVDDGERKPLIIESSMFRKGTPWAM